MRSAREHRTDGAAGGGKLQDHVSHGKDCTTGCTSTGTASSTEGTTATTGTDTCASTSGSGRGLPGKQGCSCNCMYKVARSAAVTIAGLAVLMDAPGSRMGNALYLAPRGVQMGAAFLTPTWLSHKGGDGFASGAGLAALAASFAACGATFAACYERQNAGITAQGLFQWLWGPPVAQLLQ